ncbi:aconitase family protein, partial [Microgenomates group bacterium]|nr:aconitase family protein [Microgenomates group bacterium]
LKKLWQDFAYTHDMEFFGYGQGVCHSIIEQKAEDGQLVVFTDSHTPHIGYKACGLSVGADELAAALKYRRVLFNVPTTTKITFAGKLKKGVMLRDVAMHILGLELPANTCLEYHGVEKLNCGREELAVLTNIAVEARSVTAVVCYQPDLDAQYVATITIDLGEIEPMIALPPRPQRVRKLAEFARKNPEVKIDKVWIGSCVGGSFGDLDRALGFLQDKKIARGVKLYLQPNSLPSYIGILKKYGEWIEKNQRQVKLLEAACGACMGQGEGAVKEGEVMVSTATRNLTGRNAVGSKIYLASSMTCAKAAMVGKIN